VVEVRNAFKILGLRSEGKGFYGRTSCTGEDTLSRGRNVAVDWVAFLLRVWGCSVEISGRRLDVLTKVSHISPSRQTRRGPQISHRLLSSISQPPKMSRLLKVPKLNYQIRMTVNRRNVPAYRLSKLICNHLRLYLPLSNAFIIKNSEYLTK
jgi:hypothetical protein